MKYPTLILRSAIWNRGRGSPLEDYSTAQILLLRYLLEGTFTRPTGAFVAYQDLPWGDVYLCQFQGRCIRRLAKQYGGRAGVFRQVMEGHHAVPMTFGDCAYQLEIVDQVALCLILWEGDDEYPPSAQILFSDNFPSAFSAEDATYIGDIVLNYLAEFEQSLSIETELIIDL